MTTEGNAPRGFDKDIIDQAYTRLADAIPHGTTKGEALRASCRLVGDILAQMSVVEDDDLLCSAKRIIECEYKLFLRIQ